MNWVRRDGYEICFVAGAGEDLDEVGDVDMWVTFADGQRWSGTVFTLDEARRLMDRWKDAGECLGGRYFYGWDNLMVRDPGIPAMVQVIDDLVATGDYRSALRPVGLAED
ncbi:hypothetical protein [Streptomyces regalis]|uniref:Uncharacterized protein n=1 Tax=Streptomyces regalis TaxID=68262 RepID=A0A117MMU5_9ACTN|nr:hypothetical protein [Streptomyces regalis]KUL26112.1 hypothetical protein ADL12_33535 [Streptomyces regalis]